MINETKKILKYGSSTRVKYRNSPVLNTPHKDVSIATATNDATEDLKKQSKVKCRLPKAASNAWQNESGHRRRSSKPRP